jgi:hypothetical protein
MISKFKKKNILRTFLGIIALVILCFIVLTNATTKKLEAAIVTKNDAVSLILKKELTNQSIPKYCIPIKASNGDINKLEIVNNSNAFLCNDDNKLDNGVLVELPNFSQNNQTNQFVIRNYSSIKSGGDGLVDRGSISNTGEVTFDRK